MPTWPEPGPFESGGWQPRHIGSRTPRVEDDRLLAGGGRYVADVRLPGMVEACFVRSDVAHGLIREIDTAAARAAAGVLAVAAAADLEGVAPVPDLYELARPVALFPLCRDRVRYVGAPLAVVVAADRYASEDAAELVRARIDPLPAVTSAEAALDSAAPLLYTDWPDNRLVHVARTVPEVERAFATLRRVGGSYTAQRQAPMPMETRGVVAELADGRLTVWTSTQFPHVVRTMLARVLGLPEHAIRVIAPDVGGGFGGKAEVYAEEYIVAWLALKLGRPVRWIEDRAEHMVSACHARDVRIELEAAVRDDGTIEAVRGHVVHDVGSGEMYPGGFSPSLVGAAILTGPYRIPHQQIEITCVVTNKTPSGAYRGFGQPEAVFAIERLLDEIAGELGLDGIELRRRLLIRPDELPYVTASGARIDSGSHLEAFERGVEFAAERLARARAAASPDDRVGAGIANFLEGVAANYYVTSGQWTAQDSCDIRFDPDGSATVAVGVSTTGQGLYSMVSTIAADALGLRPEHVRVVMGDTDLAPYGLGAWASRSTVVVGGAVHKAAAELRDKAVRIASQLMDASADDILIEDGRFFVAGAPSVSIGWGEIAEAALVRIFDLPPGVEPGLEARATYLPPAIQWRPDENGRLNACATYSNSTHVAIVAVDTGTGQVRVVDYGIFHDCGRVVNPALVAGQLHGGVAQGIGAALLEELPYDDEGRPAATTLGAYFVPTALDVPSFYLDELETPSSEIPFGVKGAGEAGVIGPPAAIVGAIEDALGRRFAHTPIEPRDVLEAVEP